jgi:hypothetical protein
MHTYRNGENEDQLWTVGYYTMESFGENETATSKWRSLKDFGNEKTAAAYANYMNGGIGSVWGP